MNICGKQYTVKYDYKAMGAGFTQNPPEIVIGLDCTLQEVCNSIIHEAIEAILLQDVKRWTPNDTHIAGICDDTTRFLFKFNHDYLCQFTYKLQDALLSSGYFKMVDNRPKKKRGKR